MIVRGQKLPYPVGKFVWEPPDAPLSGPSIQGERQLLRLAAEDLEAPCQVTSNQRALGPRSQPAGEFLQEYVSLLFVHEGMMGYDNV